MPALMSQIFPVRVRSAGLSIGYSIGVTRFFDTCAMPWPEHFP